MRRLSYIRITFLAAMLMLLHAASVNAQAAKKALGHIPVLTQSFSDPELQGYELFSQVLVVPPAFTDTVSHRHNAELFGYVLQGKVKIKLKGQPTEVFGQGDMFYEPRNILHTLLENVDKKEMSKILLVYIIKEGRSDYLKEYNN